MKNFFTTLIMVVSCLFLFNMTDAMALDGGTSSASAVVPLYCETSDASAINLGTFDGTASEEETATGTFTIACNGAVDVSIDSPSLDGTGTSNGDTISMSNSLSLGGIAFTGFTGKDSQTVTVTSTATLGEIHDQAEGDYSATATITVIDSVSN